MELSFLTMLLLLTEGETAGIDMTIIDAIVEIFRTIIGMFTIYPLNVFLTAGIVGLVIGVFRKLKKAAK